MTVSPFRPYRPEKALIEHMVAAGMEADAADAAARAVFAGVAATVAAQKSVHIPGIGRLSSRERRRHYKGNIRLAHKFRVAALLGPVELWEGEPWEVNHDPRR